MFPRICSYVYIHACYSINLCSLTIACRLLMYHVIITYSLLEFLLQMTLNYPTTLTRKSYCNCIYYDLVILLNGLKLCIIEGGGGGQHGKCPQLNSFNTSFFMLTNATHRTTMFIWLIKLRSHCSFLGSLIMP